MSRPPNDLPEGKADLWVAFPDEWNDPALIASACDILDDEELARMERFHFPKHRHLFMVSHLLVRMVLSHYSDLPPGAWRFSKDGNGRPLIDSAAGPFSFSLAHTRGMAVVGVTGDGDIGVDVERADRVVHAEKLSRRFFSPEEAAALEKLPPGQWEQRFPLYWTLKEAYIKAIGLGLSCPLDSFSFRLTGQRPHRIQFSTVDPPNAPKARFVVIEPQWPYVIALCLASLQHKSFEVRGYHASPSGRAAPLSSLLLGLSAGVVCMAAVDGERPPMFD